MDNRKFPRSILHRQQKIIWCGENSFFQKKIVFTKNLSASGFCFRSDQPIKIETLFFIHMSDPALDDFQANAARVFKSGPFSMARVVWVRPSLSTDDPFFEMGASFVKTEEAPCMIDLFIDFMNYHTNESIPHASYSFQGGNLYQPDAV